MAAAEVVRLQAEAVEALAEGHAGGALSLINEALLIDPAHDTLLALHEKVEKMATEAEAPREIRRRMSSKVRSEDVRAARAAAAEADEATAIEVARVWEAQARNQHASGEHASFDSGFVATAAEATAAANADEWWVASSPAVRTSAERTIAALESTVTSQQQRIATLEASLDAANAQLHRLFEEDRLRAERGPPPVPGVTAPAPAPAAAPPSPWAPRACSSFSPTERAAAAATAAALGSAAAYVAGAPPPPAAPPGLAWQTERRPTLDSRIGAILKGASPEETAARSWDLNSPRRRTKPIFWDDALRAAESASEIQAARTRHTGVAGGGPTGREGRSEAAAAAAIAAACSAWHAANHDAENGAAAPAAAPFSAS